MKKQYNVFVDFPSYVCVVVEAESADEAERIVETMEDHEIYDQDQILQNMERQTALARQVEVTM